MFSRPKLQNCQIHIFATFPSPYSVGKGDVASPPPLWIRSSIQTNCKQTLRESDWQCDKILRFIVHLSDKRVNQHCLKLLHSFDITTIRNCVILILLYAEGDDSNPGWAFENYDSGTGWIISKNNLSTWLWSITSNGNIIYVPDPLPNFHRILCKNEQVFLNSQFINIFVLPILYIYWGIY